MCNDNILMLLRYVIAVIAAHFVRIHAQIPNEITIKPRGSMNKFIKRATLCRTLKIDRASNFERDNKVAPQRG